MNKTSIKIISVPVLLVVDSRGIHPLQISTHNHPLHSPDIFPSVYPTWVWQSEGKTDRLDERRRRQTRKEKRVEVHIDCYTVIVIGD